MRPRGLIREGGLHSGNRLLDRSQSPVEGAGASQALDSLLDPVESVLESFQALRDSPKTARQPLEVARGRQVQGTHSDLLRADRALPRLERRRQRASHEGGLEQLLRELADRFLALARNSFPQRLIIGHRSGHCSAQAVLRELILKWRVSMLPSRSCRYSFRHGGRLGSRGLQISPSDRSALQSPIVLASFTFSLLLGGFGAGGLCAAQAGCVRPQ